MKNPLEVRFLNNELKKRNYIWMVLINEYFHKYIKSTDTVMDIGAGYCEFINNISCKSKIALDTSSIIKRYADKNVTTLVTPLNKIPKKYYNSIDVVFMSNFLEHLYTKNDVIDTLIIVKKLTKRNGKVVILQPNIDLMREKYWDRIDHHIALNGQSIKEVLHMTSFNTQLFIKRFLPSTMQSKIPINKLLIKIYLLLPQVLRPFAGQSIFIALKNKK